MLHGPELWLRLRGALDSQAGRQDGCQAVDLRAVPAWYQTSTRWSRGAYTSVVPFTGLITCRGEPLGSIKIKTSTRGKSKQLWVKSKQLSTVHKMQYKRRKGTEQTKT